MGSRSSSGNGLEIGLKKTLIKALLAYTLIKKLRQGFEGDKIRQNQGRLKA